MKFAVAGVAGSSASTKSAWASTVSVRSGGTTIATPGTGVGFRFVPTTRMPSAEARRATSPPISPRPRMPSV